MVLPQVHPGSPSRRPGLFNDSVAIALLVGPLSWWVVGSWRQW